MTLRLHTRYQNSAGQRVRIALNLKGIAYEYVPVPDPASGAYRSLNPQRLMPALEIGGRIVAQSMAILELLEDLYPAPRLLPEDPLRRAEVRSFAHLIAADLHPLNNNRVRKYLAAELGVDEAGRLGWYRHWVASAFTSLETQLARRPAPVRFCFDDRPGLADVCLVPQMDNARRFGCDLSPYPLLCAVDADCRRLDAFQRAAPDRQPDYPGI